ncbi:MAG: hypothetical protein U0800_03750 [Isosphaeraceae bacterium]
MSMTKIARPKLNHFASALLATITLIGSATILPGCGSGPEMGRVTGKVTYKDQPVTKGTVTFVPVDPSKGRNATGSIMSDGTYTLQTENPNDGALVGDYLVSVTSREDELLDYIPKKPVPPKRLTPEKYESPAGSGLKFTVKGGSNIFDIPLTD